MVYASLNRERIESILFHPDVAPGFFDGRPPQYHPSGIYLFSNECMFACVFRDNKLSVHPAILKTQRGKQAIIAAKNLIKWAKSLGVGVICQSDKTKPHFHAFAKMCGMSKTHDDDKYVYYEAL